MEPFYFGDNGMKLFGMIYPADRTHQLNAGVVLCYPFGQEYIRSHRAYLALATKLSQAGLHVIKFDFYGSGDSSGNQQEATVVQWLDNIHAAVQELKKNFNIEKVYLTGARLGATLSALYASQHKVDGVILWSPIISGKQYLKELKVLQDKWLTEAFARCKKRNSGEIENLGFIISAPLAKELNIINLMSLEYNNSTKFSIIDGENSAGIEQLQPKLVNRAKFIKGEGYKFWLKKKGTQDQSIVPAATIKMIVDLIVQEIRTTSKHIVFQ